MRGARARARACFHPHLRTPVHLLRVHALARAHTRTHARAHTHTRVSSNPCEVGWAAAAARSDAVHERRLLPPPAGRALDTVHTRLLGCAWKGHPSQRGQPPAPSVRRRYPVCARAECVLAAMDLVCSGTVADLVSADHGRRRPLRWAQVSGSDVRSESQDQDKGRRLSSLDEVSEPGLRSGSEDEADVVG